MTENDLSQNNDDDEWSRLVQGLLSRSVPSLPTGNKDGVHETDIDNSLKHTSMMISKYDGQSSSLPSCTLRSQTVAARTNTSSPTHNIQTLPPDASSLILSHLHPHDLHSFSLTSHKGHEMFCSELLWRLKFLDRWNCYPDFDCCGDAESDWLTDKLPHMAVNRPSSARSFWRQAYIAAHNNTHDLWIRHWNCVYPEDVTTCPGRTVVPTIRVDYCGSDLARDHVGKEHENETKETEFEKNYNATSLRMCPTCRYHPMLQYPSGYNSDVFRAVRDELDFANQQNYNEDNVMEDDPVNKAEVVAAAHSLLAHKYSNSDASNLFHNCLQSTLARAIHYSSMYSIAKWCRNIRLRYEGSGGTIFDKNESGNLSLLEMFHDRLGRIEHGINISEPNQSANFHSWQQMIQNKAIYAFECASTYNRRISADQYNSSGLHFLTDALFFNIHPSHEKDRTSSQTWRSRIGCPDNESRHKFDSNSLDDLLHDLNQQNAHESSPYSLSELGAKFETSHHSWHIVRLTNPDYVRPIAFRAYIQCRDAFTVFPSQGYLKGGETIHLVLGVRTKGSLLNEALEAIDVEREEADPSFASLHSNKGHLPFVPFIIRYMFAPCVPCLPHDFTSRPDVQSRFPFAQVHQQQAHTDFHSVLDHLWDNVTAEADVRTIPISCHVNSNYSLDEFQNATLMPFDVSTRSPSVNPSSVPLTAVLPQLQHRSPQLFSMVQNLDIELEQSYVGDCYRTEKCCRQCKRDWGGQSESLGRAYILRRLEMERHALIRSRQQADFFRTLRAIPLMLQNFLIDDENLSRARLRGLSSLLNRVRQIIYIMQTDFLIQNRANRLVTNEERQLFSSCEIYLDATYSDLQQCIHIIEHSDEECKGIVKNWRNTGVYKNARCADWVIRAESAETDNLFKAELDHLQKFGLMEYNPGGFNLGRQDDPNHEEFRSYLGSQPSMHTDMFHNNAAKAFLSALAMIGKPECLIGHGVYDRVDKPGAVIRSPSYPLDVFFRATSHRRLDAELIRNAAFLSNQWASVSCSSGMSQSRYYKSWNSCIGWKKINFEMNDPDPDGLSIVTFALRDFATNFQTAMAHFICNIPLPGQGRHVLSSPMGDHERNCDIVSIYSRVQPYSKIIFPSIPGHLEVSQNAYMTSANTQVQPPRHGDAVPNGLLVQELNIVWLIARHLGWTVDDDQSRGAILVDRRVLIAVQWFSNTIMVFSLLASLLSRKFKLVKSIPADFHFFGGPTPVINNDMRFWTAEECGFAAVIVFGFYFVLGRLSERNISRTYDREMRESIEERTEHSGIVRNAFWRLSQWGQRCWDCTCPLFLQMLIFMPLWNKRSQQEILHHISFKRSMDCREHRSSFHADNGRGRMSVNVANRKLGFWSYVIGLSFALLSFSACSPHFVVNSLTVFCCSLAFGMSMSVESLESVRRTTSTGVLSMVKPRRLNTLVTGLILVGQLVGGSGGIIFLAEFVVTTICLILGGAATITARAVESWITFLCLASTAFWGFVFARLGLLDTVRTRRRGIPSALLLASLCSAFLMWVGVMTRVDWQALTPGDLVLIQSHQLLSMIRERWWH